MNPYYDLLVVRLLGVFLYKIISAKDPIQYYSLLCLVKYKYEK